MWVETPSGELVNLANAESISLERYVVQSGDRYTILVWFANGTRRTLATFDNKKDANEFMTVLKEQLFGKQGGKHVRNSNK